MKSKIYFRLTSFVLIMAILNLSVGCHYYKVQTAKTNEEGLAEITADKYLIIHFQKTTFNLSSIKIDKENKLISGTKENISFQHIDHLAPKKNTNRYNRKYGKPDNEIHIYVNAFNELGDGQININADDIDKIDIYDKAVGATVASYTFSTLGILAGLFLIILLIVALTKSSCPFIYIKDGDEFVFYGETFGGAIAQNLERDDYMPLPSFKSQNGKYILKIANELKERQYTDIAELFIVEHDKDATIYGDKNGNLFQVKDHIAPKEAKSSSGNYLNEIAEIDTNYFNFFDESDNNPDFSNIDLTFDKAKNVDQAHLILNVKNTLWSDYIIGEFFAQFGDRYEEFVKQQQNVPAEEKIQWTKDQGMLMSVEVKTDDGWEHVDYINLVGPLAARSIMIPVDLKNVSSENLEFRLSAGFHFWELDFASISYDAKPVNYEVLKPSKAIDESGIDVSDQLMKVDGNRLSQPEIGNEAIITYKAPSLRKRTHKQSVFLHTKGYYETIRDYQGKSKIRDLKKFKEKGAFTRFSKERLTQVVSMK